MATYKKIELDGKTLIDLTGDTLTTADVYGEKQFHLYDGTIATKGTMPDVITTNITKSTATVAMPIVSTAGYAPTMSISGITIPAGKSLTVTNKGTATVSSVNTGTSAASWTGTVIVSAPTISTATTATTATIVTDGVWNSTTVTPGNSTITKYGKVTVNPMSSGTAATFANITTSSSTLNVQIVKSAGYTGIKYISDLNIPGTIYLNSITASTPSSTTATSLAVSTLTIGDYRKINYIANSGTIGTLTNNNSGTITNLNNSGTITNFSNNDQIGTLMSTGDISELSYKSNYIIDNKQCIRVSELDGQTTFTYSAARYFYAYSSSSQGMYVITCKNCSDSAPKIIQLGDSPIYINEFLYEDNLHIGDMCITILFKNISDATQTVYLGFNTTSTSSSMTTIKTFNIESESVYIVQIPKQKKYSSTTKLPIIVSKVKGYAI